MPQVGPSPGDMAAMMANMPGGPGVSGPQAAVPGMAQTGGIPQGGDMAAMLTQPTGGVQPAPDMQPDSNIEALMAHIREGVKAGKVKRAALKIIEALAEEGADAGTVIAALQEAAMRGRADKAFAAEVAGEFGGGEAGTPPVTQAQDGGAETLLQRVHAGVKAGTVLEGIAQALEALAAQGAGADVIREALQNAVTQGLVRRELLAGM